MNWKTCSLSAGLALILLGYSNIPAGAQTAPTGGSMQHSGASNCDAMQASAMGSAMSNGEAMKPEGSAMAQGEAMKPEGSAMQGDAMQGGAMAQGEAMSGAMASGAMSECNAPSAAPGAQPNSAGSR
ncbi:MAG: hypothetical protein KME15_03220 [Drouetiella hepatica Uher 2000/2452]|jgi:hypothetical protein|uniref:Pentapeptide MXKDX repeat protein n=1 Tax=Drouetiella hepatica Uher 2000/2452 TaxID=904376 RepID=A0A951Q866_9CYAN|nr:hypothetical protein [Drouetiella hepatica Uher 2000/2452]